MIYEDEGAEKLALEGEFELAIPFSLYAYNNGDVKINVFPSLRADAEEFLSRFSGDVMFTEGVDWAHRRFRGFLEQHGYSTDDETGYFLDYRVEGAHSGLILPGTFRVSGGEKLENLTGYDFETLSGYGHICFALEADGKIVSAACTNYPFILADGDQEERIIEIGVETAPEYRRRGYGISCAAALATELYSRGMDVLYECASGNEGSVALVKRLGGKLFAKNFCVVGRKTDD